MRKPSILTVRFSWNVSESVLGANHQETSETSDNPAATSGDFKTNQNDPVLVALATDDEIDEMGDDQLLKYIKARFNALLGK